MKKKINAQLLWQAERINHSLRKYIWEKFKNFLKNNIKKIFTRKENIYDEYLKYKQNLKQSIMNYDVHKIALRAKLTLQFKFNANVNLQNFIKSLRENHKDFVYDHDFENKTTILNRLKFRENRDVKKRFNNNNNKFEIIKDKQTNDFNKRKRNNENFEDDEDKINKTINSKNNKDDKKFKSNNFNRESIKNKNNNKLYRFIKIEYENIKINNKCFDCD